MTAPVLDNCGVELDRDLERHAAHLKVPGRALVESAVHRPALVPVPLGGAPGCEAEAARHGRRLAREAAAAAGLGRATAGPVRDAINHVAMRVGERDREAVGHHVVDGARDGGLVQQTLEGPAVARRGFGKAAVRSLVLGGPVVVIEARELAGLLDLGSGTAVRLEGGVRDLMWWVVDGRWKGLCRRVKAEFEGGRQYGVSAVN